MVAGEKKEVIPRKSSRFSASRLLANFSPAAAFRKGQRISADEPNLTPELEAHLCQLAVLENYAEHGMFVKFSDDEANVLEDKALNLALEESKGDEGAGNKLASRSSSITSQTYTAQEAEKFLATLRSDGDPLFSEVAPAVAAGRSPSADLQNAAVSGAGVSRRSRAAEAPKVSSFSAFKKKLLTKVGRSWKAELPAVPPSGSQLPPGTLEHGYSCGSYDHFAAEAADKGMEYSNGYIFPREYVSELEMQNAADAVQQSGTKEMGTCSVADQPPDTNTTEGALLAVAMEESRAQAEFDDALRDAKMLRQDLEHERMRCVEKQKEVEAKKNNLEARTSNLSSKQGLPPHLAKASAEADHNAKEAQSRVTALGDAVEELGHLEAYVCTIKPPKDDAIALSEIIVRELLEQLNFAGFHFHVPDAKDRSDDVNGVLAKYRQVNPARSRPASLAGTPVVSPRPESTQAPSSPFEGAAGDHDQSQLSSQGSQPQTPKARESARASTVPRTPPQIETRAKPLPSPQSPSTPVKSPRSAASKKTSLANKSSTDAAKTVVEKQRKVQDAPAPLMTRASQRLQRLASDKQEHATKQPLTKTASSKLSLESVGSVRSLRSLEDKMSSPRLPTGPVTTKRVSQVVSLFNEMRKKYPNRMDLTYSTAQPASTTKRARALANPDRNLCDKPEVTEAVKAEADKHARLITRLGATVARAKPKDMEEACNLIKDAEMELAAVRLHVGAVLMQIPEFPEAKWRALNEATAVHMEVECMSDRMRNWSLNQGTYQEEAKAMEEYFDTMRVHMDQLQSQVTQSERRWLSCSIPWDNRVFRRCRISSLHVATLFMSRALFEVANLERSQSLKADACINDLGDAVRIAFKVHQFVGGFHSDAIELFEKVKRLTQYYVRSRDPTWLKDTTKLTS